MVGWPRTVAMKWRQMGEFLQVEPTGMVEGWDYRSGKERAESRMTSGFRG